MTTSQNFVNRAHAICDCIPVVSTITNGAELIYRLAHKVHTAASVITPGIQTSLKIHALSKEKIDYLPLIPILGNLFHILKEAIRWLTNYQKPDTLKKAIQAKNVELVQLVLTNAPLEDTKRTNEMIKLTKKKQMIDLICANRYEALLKEESLDFSDVKEILIKGTFSKEEREALISKVKTFHLLISFKAYFNGIVDYLPQIKKEGQPLFYETQLDILNRILSTIEDKNIGDYLSSISDHVKPRKELLVPLITQHETQFTPEQKAAILKKAIPSLLLHSFSSDLAKSALFLQTWGEKWGACLPAQGTQAILHKLSEGENSPYAGDFGKKKCQELKQLFSQYLPKESQ